MTKFPFFEEIEGKTFLVVGGGPVAAGKVEKLKAFGADVLVVAEETALSPEGITLERRAFREEDLDRADFVIGATDDPALHLRLAELCRTKGLPVNLVDMPEQCTFVFPSLIKRGDLTIAISTNGKAPAFARRIREQIEPALPENAESIIDTLYQKKQELLETEPDRKERARVLRQLLNDLIEEDTE